MDAPGHRSAPCARAGPASHHAARGLLRGLPRARQLSVRDIAPHRTGGARADRGAVGNVRRARTADALLTVRKEGRGGLSHQPTDMFGGLRNLSLLQGAGPHQGQRNIGRDCCIGGPGV